MVEIVIHLNKHVESICSKYIEGVIESTGTEAQQIFLVCL